VKPQPRIGFGGKRGLGWVLLASWLVPLMMTAAYIVLIATSEVDATGAAWEAIAFAFVVVLWMIFRVLTEHAAMARAVDVGDADHVIELADFQLSRTRRVRARARYHVYRALAFDIRGDAAAALAELDKCSPTGTARTLAATIRVSALAETGHAADARKLYESELTVAPRDPQLAILARLAEARLLRAEGNEPAASALFSKLADNVRAGSGIRSRAKAYSLKLTA